MCHKNSKKRIYGMYKVGLSSRGFELTEENFAGLGRGGVDVIEIATSPDKYKVMDFNELVASVRRYGVDVWSCHLPFYPFKYIDISSKDKELRDNAYNLYRDIISRAAQTGIDKFIVHPSGEPISDDERGERLKYSMQSLDALAELAHTHGARIAVEDLPRTCLGNTAEEILLLTSANEKLRVVFDTNHLLKGNTLDFMDALGDKIISVHVSDYDYIDERHWLPGEGKIDWVAVMDKFEQIGYSGAWMYEVSLKAEKTISRPRDLTFEDFRRNASEIFERKPLTVLGVPNIN